MSMQAVDFHQCITKQVIHRSHPDPGTFSHQLSMTALHFEELPSKTQYSLVTSLDIMSSDKLRVNAKHIFISLIKVALIKI